MGDRVTRWWRRSARCRSGVLAAPSNTREITPIAIRARIQQETVGRAKGGGAGTAAVARSQLVQVRSGHRVVHLRRHVLRRHARVSTTDGWTARRASLVVRACGLGGLLGCLYLSLRA
jgi:hypothetical protein